MVDILIVGNGARESALGLKFLNSPQVEHVYVAPGNDGMKLLGLETVAIDVLNFADLKTFAQTHAVALTFVGPEVPLVAGIVDNFEAAGLPIFGANKALAQMEGSKTFAKEFMQRHALPTARARFVDSLAAARAVLSDWGAPIVIKADGLAAGKGVVVALTTAVAQDAIADLYAANPEAPVVIEEFLTGQEASVMALFAGDQRVILPLSQDHKRRFAGDAGPNTGGMGAMSPLPQFSGADEELARDLMARTLAGLRTDGLTGCGVVYMGLIFTAAGPRILEYNMRFGDPETQVLLPQIQNDFYTLITDLLAGRAVALHLDGRTYVGVVLTHPGYPATSQPALPVSAPSAPQNGHWVPAAVRADGAGLVTSGGRVVTVVGSGVDAYAARAAAYAQAHLMAGELAYRDDIGYHAFG